MRLPCVIWQISAGSFEVSKDSFRSTEVLHIQKHLGGTSSG